jgi:oxazoline/thiazoline dehydrogenase
VSGRPLLSSRTAALLDNGGFDAPGRNSLRVCFPDPLTGPRLLLRVPLAARLVRRLGCSLIFKTMDDRALRIDARFPDVADALVRLTQGGADLATLVSLASCGREREAVGQLQDSLRVLKESGLCEYVWEVEGRQTAIITDVCRDFEFSEVALEPDPKVMLSRFAFAHRDGCDALLESPEALCRITFSSSEVWQWLGLLLSPISAAEVLSIAGRQAYHFVDVLWRTGFVERTDIKESQARASWEFHDMVFHWRSRGGRSTKPQGGTYRFLSAWPSPPAVKPRMSRDVQVLPKPPNPQSADSLIGVIERRRSSRDQGPRTISVADVSQLLYYALRIQRRLPGEYQELALRPVPAAGAIHELEAYLAVHRCDGLERGLYHYHAEQHTLHRLSAREQELAQLIEDAAESRGKPNDPPQVLVILASRLPRLAWKYEGIAYRLTLLNAGAVIESFYLLATQLGLACTALGGGNSATFAAAAGLDPLEETSVAEFAIGSGLALSP